MQETTTCLFLDQVFTLRKTWTVSYDVMKVSQIKFKQRDRFNFEVSQQKQFLNKENSNNGSPCDSIFSL